MNYKEYLKLALPFTLSTITQPLMGAMDTAIIGRLGDSAYIGGVAVGAVIFSTLYWLFGFLRVSTSGFSAQALGTQNEKDGLLALVRPASIALAVSALFLLLQTPIKNIAMQLLAPTDDVAVHAMTYYDILIWGAPCVLMSYVTMGWLMGKKKVKESMFLQIFSNVLNIALDLVFVIIFKLGVAGVAYGTLIAQIVSLIIGFYLVSREIRFTDIRYLANDLLDRIALKKIMAVNGDLMVRTICLLVMTNMFVAKGASFGTDILAANAVLFQVQYILAYFFDGFANASSVFTGVAVGKNDRVYYRQVLLVTNGSTLILAVVMTGIVYIGGDALVRMFTDLTVVREISYQYTVWLALFPIAVAVGLVHYGVFSGGCYTAAIRNSMILSLLVFLAVYFVAIPIYGNHGLWLAFILFSLGRSVFLAMYIKSFERNLFSTGNMIELQ